MKSRDRDERITRLRKSAQQAVANGAEFEVKAQHLAAALQELDMTLKKERREAHLLREELQNHEARHQEVCERSEAEIQRLSAVGKDYEGLLAELAKHILPPGMTWDNIMAAAKTTPLQLVPVGRAHQPANLQLEYTAEYLAGTPGRNVCDTASNGKRKQSSGCEGQRDAKRSGTGSDIRDGYAAQP